MKLIRKISILPVLLAVGGLVAASVVEAQPPQSVKQLAVARGVVQVGDEAPNLHIAGSCRECHESLAAQGKGRAAEFLGDLVWTLSCRDAGDGTTLSHLAAR